MRITVKVRRYPKDQAFTHARNRILTQLGKTTDTAAQRIVKTSQGMMAASKSGIHHPGLPRRSSRTGEAPATQSGKMSRSIQASVANKTGVYRKVGSPLWYANYLMTHKDRPLLLPALQREAPAYVEDVRRIIGRSI